MHKFNLPMLWIWILIALTASGLTAIQEQNGWNQPNKVFETQSTRTISSLGFQSQNQITPKEHCSVTFDSQIVAVNQSFTITVNWIVNNGKTIETVISWPNSWWWINNFAWFPLTITDAKDTPWTYVYRFIINGDSVITCEWTITIWKRTRIDPIGPGPSIDAYPLAKP